MGTIAEQINYLADTKTAIKEALVAKGVSVAESDTFRSYADKIDQIQVNNSITEYPFVTFIDYDGTQLYEYSAEEFLLLEEMPEAPYHEGLVFDGWNWSLEDAKEQVSDGYWCDIGALYVTNDSTTRVYISIEEEYETEVRLTISGNNTVNIDWGDGKTSSYTPSSNSNPGHIYSTFGEYVIKISPASEQSRSYILGRGSNQSTFLLNNNVCRKVELGPEVGLITTTVTGSPKLQYLIMNNSTSLPSESRFSFCVGLQSLIFPNKDTVEFYPSLKNCNSLKRISFPKNTSRVYIEENAQLERVVLPKNTTIFDLLDCYKLSQIKINENHKNISIRNANISNIEKIEAESIGIFTGVEVKNIKLNTTNATVLKDNKKLTSFEALNSNTFGYSTFSGCNNLIDVNIGEGATDIKDKAFENCYSLKNVQLPNTITSIGTYAFLNCKNLERIELPNNVTNLEEGVFDGCVSLKTLKLGNSVTKIGKYTFRNCPSLNYIKYPPTVTSFSTNYFTPTGSSDAYLYIVEDFSDHTQVPTFGTDSMTSVKIKRKRIVNNGLIEEWVDKTGSTPTPFYSDVECKSLDILSVEEVSGNVPYTSVTMTAHCRAKNYFGEIEDNAIINIKKTFNIGENTSTLNSVEKTINFSYGGYDTVINVTQRPYVENCIVCKYNVTKLSETQLLYSSFSNYSNYFSSMIIDGIEVPIEKTYTFNSVGEHEVIFKIKEDTSITSLYSMFRGCNDLTYVDCTEADLSAVNSTSNSSGTAYMFYDCKNLKTIILPSTIVYLGYYMFGYCSNTTTLIIKASTAPTVNSNAFGYSTTYSTYIGYTSRQRGTNKLYVPVGATGYDNSRYNTLFNTSYCGFTKVEVENL